MVDKKELKEALIVLTDFGVTRGGAEEYYIKKDLESSKNEYEMERKVRQYILNFLEDK